MIEISRRAVLFGLFYVMIKKFDDEKRVVYQFGPNEKQMGEIEFDK